MVSTWDLSRRTGRDAERETAAGIPNQPSPQAGTGELAAERGRALRDKLPVPSHPAEVAVPCFTDLDVVAMSLEVTAITGHQPGTFEHERCFQRVQSLLEHGVAVEVRGRTRGVKVTLHPAQFRAKAVA